MKRMADVLFYFHLFLIVGMVVMGFYLPPMWMLGLVLAHQVQLSVFKGCLLTAYEKKIKGIPKRDEFFQYTLRRLFGLRISKKEGRVLSLVIACFAIAISVVRNVS